MLDLTVHIAMREVKGYPPSPSRSHALARDEHRVLAQLSVQHLTGKHSDVGAQVCGLARPCRRAPRVAGG